jgi:hypothetical protein
MTPQTDLAAFNHRKCHHGQSHGQPGQAIAAIPWKLIANISCMHVQTRTVMSD